VPVSDVLRPALEEGHTATRVPPPLGVGPLVSGFRRIAYPNGLTVLLSEWSSDLKHMIGGAPSLGPDGSSRQQLLHRHRQLLGLQLGLGQRGLLPPAQHRGFVLPSRLLR
jgi:hypothetical protein